MTELYHLRVVDSAEARPFRSTLTVRQPTAPQRDRATHGQKLLLQFAALTRREAEISQLRAERDLPRQGMSIVLEISPKGYLDYKTLEWRREGIEVLNVSEADASDLVVVFVPDGHLTAFVNRITEYLEQDTRYNRPKNAALVNVIENVRKAAFDELWTDFAPAPLAAEPKWFQLWLRELPEGPLATRNNFVELTRQLGIEVEPGFVTFPGRVVIAAFAPRAFLEDAIELLDAIAEIRSVSPTAEFFLSQLDPFEQAEWVNNLVERTTHAEGEDVPYVALFDTGVNRGHPLLSPGLADSDLHALQEEWRRTDHHGHGTQMAGLLLHGNLVDPLASNDAYQVPHRLESVKILPSEGENPPHLYGWITEKAATTVEGAYPNRRRTFAMMTTSEGQTTGSPSEWSATIDRLAFGAPNTVTEEIDGAQVEPRLFVLSAGNVGWPHWNNYPAINDLTPIENPGQAWNAITVGACTYLTDFNQDQYPSYKAIASAGGLSPSSTTSLMWTRTNWPYKPDVVAEGGNACLDAGIHVDVGPENLRLLTTSHEMAAALLTETGDTSAATAEVARLCARLSDRYPDYWPETLRALVIHGARYTPAMLAQLPLVRLMRHKLNLLMRYGYGAISPSNSLSSTATRATLVLQETIKPYRVEGSNIKLNTINLHELPWPAAVLQGLGEATVALRITLSHFVDPNPSQRGWQSKFRYQSHGLRFSVKGATESAEEFNRRINLLERAAATENGEDEHGAFRDVDSTGWFLGTRLQSRGSIHSDVWMGTAAELAEKSHIAVFPVGGWWKDWKGAGQPTKAVRYSLVVTLEVAEGLEVDIYTPILAQIPVTGVVVPIDVDQG